MYVIIPVLAVAITLLVIQLLSRNTLQRIAYRCEVNMSLVEPDEVATLTYRVYNTSSWPIMFVSFSFQFDDAVEVRESDEWKARHGSHSFLAEARIRAEHLPDHRLQQLFRGQKRRPEMSERVRKQFFESHRFVHLWSII